ncbi:salivary glue protein Sgs-3 [Rhipicephalus sanguineus]|uniref:salivary glue protein Sgs-3 n=1 Tax=Rhipicephalus sanguineus TaxID=34632 RepID=UPI0018940736|nr:salivary glue protein Sgs-3 [Rhipicephalus sanguineus]
MGGRRQPASTSLFINLLIAITACTGQKLQAVESNGVFFSGLPRPPSETNAITAKGGGDLFGNTLGRGLQEKFTTPNPLKTGSTPFDFRFNSAKPDNRFVMLPASGPRTPSTFVTRPTFFTGGAPTTTAPRAFVPTTPRPVPPPPPPPPRPPAFRPPTFAQTTSQQATQRLTTFRPVTQRPTTERPVTERFTTQRPTTQRLTTQRSTTQRPITQRPTTQRPTTQRPTTQRVTTQRPTILRPTTPRPTTPRPTTARLTTPRQTTLRPTIPRLTTPRQTTPRPTVPFPTTPRPTTQRPTTPRPVTQRPTLPPRPAPSLRPTILQELPPTPRLAFQPGTAQNAVFTGRQANTVLPRRPIFTRTTSARSCRNNQATYSIFPHKHNSTIAGCRKVFQCHQQRSPFRTSSYDYEETYFCTS